MTSARGVARTLAAWQAGRPLPRYETRHHAVAPPEQVLIVAFVRMAGESRPWGIAWGSPAGEPRCASVPDGRVRDDVARMCAELAGDLIGHLSGGPAAFDPRELPPDPADLRQLWLPNGQHIAMLHQLAYTYSQTRFGGADRDLLRALGRLAGWLFRDSCRAGNQHVVDASARLNETYIVPAQRARTAHLGYTLGWCATTGDREQRLAAAMAAERLTVSPTMDPALERNPLAELVNRWNECRRAGTDPSGPAERIARVLTGELQRRWRLTAQAYDVLASDPRPVNAGVAALVVEGQREFWYQYQRMEASSADPLQGPVFIAHPETDFHGSAAASGYLRYAAADEAYSAHLIHDDAALFAEALHDGRAFEADIVAVEDLGAGRAHRPQWLLRLDPSRPHRLRENTRIAPLGSRGHEASVVDIQAGAGDLLVTVEWVGRKTKPLSGPFPAAPLDFGWEGRRLGFVLSDAASLTIRRSRRVWDAASGPGAWLTHGAPSAPVEVRGEDGRSDLLVDDIAQITDGIQV